MLHRKQQYPQILSFCRQKMMITTMFIFVLFGILGITRFSFAATYYVALDGLDTNPGTVTAPWGSFKNAISSQIKPGDTIFIRGGIYNQLHNFENGTLPEAILPINRFSGIQGDPTNPITYKAYPGETVVFDPQYQKSAIHIQGIPRTGIIIDGIEIRNGRPQGIFIEDNASHLIIRNARIHGSDGSPGDNVGGIVVNASHHVTIENNIFYDNYIHSVFNLNGANIFVFSGTNNIGIRNNEMYDSEHGVFYKHHGNGPSVIENNYMHDLRRNGIWSATDNLTMRNNLFVRVGTAVNIHEEAGCSACSRDNVFIHNTVVHGGSYRLNEPSSQAGAIRSVIKDNIFFNPGSSIIPTIWEYGSDAAFTNNIPDLRASHNTFWGSNLRFNYFGNNNPVWGILGGIYTLSQFQSMGHELNSLSEDPLFENVVTGDYHLQLQSSSRATASDGTDRGANIALIGVQSSSTPPPSPTSDTQAPTPPGSLSASVISPTQINLSWSASTDNVGVTGYRLERCTGAGCTNFTQIAAPTNTGFQNTTVIAGTTYQYRMRATDAAGNLSEYSSIVSATTPNSTPTPTPTPSGNTCTNWQTLHPEWIWCDDFEDTTPLDQKYTYYESAGGRFVRTTGTGANSGSFIMASRYDPGIEQSGTLWFNFGRNPVSSLTRTAQDFTDVYWRMFVKNQSGWSGNPQKLTRARVVAGSNWADAATAHVWEGTGLALGLDPVSGVAPDGTTLQTTGYNDIARYRWLGFVTGQTQVYSSARADQWQCIEAHMQLNTPGQSNGVFDLWIDDVLDASRNNLNWRSSWQQYGINHIAFENWWNQGATPQVQYRYWDDLVISTQRIGCDTTPPDITPPPDTTPPAVPGNVRVE